MSLRTTISEAEWVLTCFDGREIYLTQEEYGLYLELVNITETRMMIFDDGGFALADIKRIEKKKKSASFDESALVLGNPDPTPEEAKETIKNYEILIQKTKKNTRLPKDLKNKLVTFYTNRKKAQEKLV